MANAVEHAQWNFILSALGCALVRYQEGRALDAIPLTFGAAAAALPSLPDLFEPAVNPNHRQLFHSVGMFGAIGYSTWKLVQWQPEDDWQRLLRVLGLVGGAAYLSHLARDAFTPKSLPVI